MRSLNKNSYKSRNHSKFLLQFHVILVCKYRLRLLTNDVSIEIKKLSNEIVTKYGCSIKYVESDLDHIHYLIETLPTINLSKLVMALKSYTTYHIWKKFNFSSYLWKEKTFWTSGYFISSIGSVSEKTIQKYIENQGGKNDQK